MRLPGTSRQGHYLYVVQFNTGTLKVGRTMNPAVRLKNHATASRPHGISVSAQWLSQPHPMARANERSMIAFCDARYTSTNDGEYYLDAPPEQVVAHAERLLASHTGGETLAFTRYGRLAGRDGAWPQEDPAVVVPLPDDLAAQLDAVRGTRTRAEWLQELAVQHLGTH